MRLIDRFNVNFLPSMAAPGEAIAVSVESDPNWRERLQKTKAFRGMKISNNERVIVALDVPTAEEARRHIAELREFVGAFKIGLQLFTSAGPEFVKEVVGQGSRIFLDLKFHDIPNTVAKAGVEAARLGVWMFNVHAAGGSLMMRRTFEEVGEACARENIDRPKIIAVTVLTSSGQAALTETGVDRELDAQVLNLAQLTAECGLDGVVASPKEVGKIRAGVGNDEFLIVTPGIRPANETNHDQERVMTAGAALSAGADYLVIGRPILQSDDKVSTVERIIAGMDSSERQDLR